MDAVDLFRELYGRVPPLAREAVGGLDGDALTWAPGPGSNTIGWLVWHLARVEDHHVTELVGGSQVYVDGDWGRRFGLAADPDDFGYGHGAADVAAVRPDGPDALTGYLDAVRERTHGFFDSLGPADLDRVVDERWDPPVTMGVRLVSIADDALQHVGQANYLRGLLERSG